MIIMGGSESTGRKVSFGMDEEDRVRVLRGVRVRGRAGLHVGCHLEGEECPFISHDHTQLCELHEGSPTIQACHWWEMRSAARRSLCTTLHVTSLLCFMGSAPSRRIPL